MTPLLYYNITTTTKENIMNTNRTITDIHGVSTTIHDYETYTVVYADESGRINVNCEGYECGGRYSVYAYNGKANHSLYEGKSAKQAAIAMVNALTMIRLMRM